MNSFLNILKALFLGFITGFIMAIPLGPAGIEAVKRTISSEFKEGFKVSLGALAADMTYLLIINAGLSSLLSKNKRTEALFWIISGFILMFIGYKSIRSNNNNKLPLFEKISKGNSNKSASSFPFLAGYLMTISNPMVPSLWIFMSSTVIRAWYYISITSYYTFIFAILLGKTAWFAILNYLALKGIKFLTPSASNKTSVFLMIGIFILGFGFVIFGLIKLII